MKFKIKITLVAVGTMGLAILGFITPLIVTTTPGQLPPQPNPPLPPAAEFRAPAGVPIINPPAATHPPQTVKQPQQAPSSRRESRRRDIDLDAIPVIVTRKKSDLEIEIDAVEKDFGRQAVQTISAAFDLSNIQKEKNERRD